MIASSYDLGSITSLWRKPRTYARFLGAELQFVYKDRLLIVMPNGFGISRQGQPVDREVVRTFEMLGIVMLLATQLTAVWMYRNGHTTDMRMAWSRFSFPGLRQDMTRLMEW